MNPDAQAYLDSILKKSPKSLNDDEIAFLRARRDYLKASQAEEYESVLNQTPKGTVKKDAKKEK